MDRREADRDAASLIFFALDACALFSSNSCRILADLAFRMRLKHFGGFGMSPVNTLNAVRPK